MQSPSGKMAILFPGLGSVATTTIAGILLARRGILEPVGSITQMGVIGSRESACDGPNPIKSILPMAELNDLVFGGWDIFPDNAYEAAAKAAVLRAEHLEIVRDEMEAIRPMRAVFYPEFVRNLRGTHTKPLRSRAFMVQLVRRDIRQFLRRHRCDRAVVIWSGSTERRAAVHRIHKKIDDFERALVEDDPTITSSQIYAWACIREGIPFANTSPNLAIDFPAASELALREGVPIAGNDLKTGQTLLKTILAPGIKARMLGIRGWFSTNILGNRDGEVLSDPGSFRTKEASKLESLQHLLQPERFPSLYGELVHKVRIEFYPPAGDAKEAWDNIDIFGWLGYPMQIKINFLARDSILAAPLVLDLALLLDVARRAGWSGIQEWLAFYFKAPMAVPPRTPEHDLFLQLSALDRAIWSGVNGERNTPLP